jgi:hypothetical protein
MFPRELDDGFERVAVSHALTVVDRSRLTFRVEHSSHLRCVRAARFAFSRYEWTGSGDESTPSIGPAPSNSGAPAPKLHGPAIELPGGGRLLVVDLGRIYEAGDESRLEIRHTFVDIRRTFKPYLTHSTTKGNRSLELTVRLPAEDSTSVHFATEIVDSEHRESTRAAAVVVEVEGALYNQYRLSVAQPVEGRRYAIHWNW